MQFTKPRAATLLFVASCVAAGISQSAAQDKKAAPPLTPAEAKKLKSPIPYSKKSIGLGRNVFARYCTGCHGADGKSMVDVVSDATDLTTPRFYKSGSTEGEVFKSIRNGAGETMPAFHDQIPDEQNMWHLVNFIRSLWPEGSRPPLQDDEAKK